MKKIALLIIFCTFAMYGFTQSNQLIGKTLKITGTSSVVIDGIVSDIAPHVSSNVKLPTARSVAERIEFRISGFKDSLEQIYDRTILTTGTAAFNSDTLSKYVLNNRLRQFDVTVMGINQSNNEKSIYKFSVFVSKEAGIVNKIFKNEVQGTSLEEGAFTTADVVIKNNGGVTDAIVVIEITPPSSATNVRWRVTVTPLSEVELEAL